MSNQESSENISERMDDAQKEIEKSDKPITEGLKQTLEVADEVSDGELSDG